MGDHNTQLRSGTLKSPRVFSYIRFKSSLESLLCYFCVCLFFFSFFPRERGICNANEHSDQCRLKICITNARQKQNHNKQRQTCLLKRCNFVQEMFPSDLFRRLPQFLDFLSIESVLYNNVFLNFKFNFF